jgi:hypothetical protein
LAKKTQNPVADPTLSAYHPACGRPTRSDL